MRVGLRADVRGSGFSPTGEAPTSRRCSPPAVRRGTPARFEPRRPEGRPTKRFLPAPSAGPEGPRSARLSAGPRLADVRDGERATWYIRYEVPAAITEPRPAVCRARARGAAAIRSLGESTMSPSPAAVPKTPLALQPLSTSASLRDQAYAALKQAIIDADVYSHPGEVRLDE